MSLPVYSPFVAQEVLDRIAEGQTLKSICVLEGFPKYTTICEWKRRYPDFKAAFDRAMLVSATLLADEELALSRETAAKSDVTAPEVQARKMLSDSLRWHARTRNPNRYGDKTQLEHSIAPRSPESLTDAELVEVIALSDSGGTGGATNSLPEESPA